MYVCMIYSYNNILLLILTYCIHVMYIVIDNICILLYIIYVYNIVIYILILCNNVCNIIGGYNIYIIYNMGKYKSRE